MAEPDATPDPLAKLVHDLRSPLMVADGFAQLLARDDGSLTPEQRAEFARRVVDAMADMRALLDAAR
ncbi:MAG TPA: histidine kinase dimerization/phospho-acceptor domain-containing protein [Solirubrobacteraceae bacterium]|nr:histidine kinase dimerization/phospho-acceptor domain-containing protein [Solirubrobacteraceae bacterium]